MLAGSEQLLSEQTDEPGSGLDRPHAVGVECSAHANSRSV